MAMLFKNVELTWLTFFLGLPRLAGSLSGVGGERQGASWNGGSTGLCGLRFGCCCEHV